ncbi:hypothetical protein QBC40DRAFT_343881 [Triangularia verruculosa]|uniref:Aminoglycoside phosphotransferase domain-containing protein n=1 Tax=Triangularia verruculosa TaxID=2587418 RepID=A0AAN6X7G2_9PEZI|nr:hypothetical protein QBC40DRAFT_343881 [Triangularia verruculosa]
MSFVVYNLDSTVSSFFAEAGASSSRSQCDEFVRQRHGGQIQPATIQGSNSYTVIAGPAGDKVVQFREQSALLDVAMLKLAKEIHGDVVPSGSDLGWVGDTSLGRSPLAVYEMYKLPGETFVTTRLSLEAHQRLNTVRDLASFFAQAWLKGEATSSHLVDLSAIKEECHARFKYLTKTLPERFLPVVNEVRALLPALLDGNYPLVLTHSDLNEMNILVNPDTGEITGVIDWADASIQPFGFTLYALENALGNMSSGGWKWFDNADELRDAFWKDFVEKTGVSESETRLIKLAAKAGILIRYGTAYDAGLPGMIGVRDPSSEDDRYLDALLL